VQYNYGLALQRRGRQQEAEKALVAAYDLDPGDADVVHALVVHYAQRGRSPEALGFARELARLVPGSPDVARLVESLEGSRQ
jgi:Flp pilus assembly protein TadD